MTRLAPSRAIESAMALPIPLLPPVTMATLPCKVMLLLRISLRRSNDRDALLEAVDEVFADADGVGLAGGAEGWVAWVAPVRSAAARVRRGRDCRGASWAAGPSSWSGMLF